MDAKHVFTTANLSKKPRKQFCHNASKNETCSKCTTIKRGKPWRTPLKKSGLIQTKKQQQQQQLIAIYSRMT